MSSKSPQTARKRKPADGKPAATILDHGALVHEGEAAELLRDSRLLDRYVSVTEVPVQSAG